MATFKDCKDEAWQWNYQQAMDMFNGNHDKAIQYLKDHPILERLWFVQNFFHFVFHLYWTNLQCKIFGHDYECEADVENGSEEVWCNRCGYYHKVYF